MTVVTGDIRLVTDKPASVSQVWLRAPKGRVQGTAYVTESPDAEPVENGAVTFTAFPGPLVMVLVAQGQPLSSVKLIVPDKSNATLRECIEAVGLVDDGTLSALEELALEVSSIAGQIASADQLERWATETAQAAQGIEQAASSVESSASRAAASESNAKTSETNAVNSAASALNARDSVVGSVNAAATSATNAAGHADRAKDSETGAKTSEANALSAAERAEFAAEETIQQVEGDFATRNYVDASRWESRLLETGEDLNECLKVGQYRSVLSSVTQSIKNAPAGAKSDKGIALTLGGSTGGLWQYWLPIQGSSQQDVWIRSRTAAGTWFPWERLLRGKDAWIRGTLTSNTDLNTVTESGVYWSGLYSITSTLVNRPPGTGGIPTGFFTVHNVGRGRVKQRWEKVSAVGQYQSVMERQRDVSGNWSEWRDSNPGQSVSATETPEPAARAEMLRQASKLRHGRVVGTSGATPVALSFDHGTTNFRTLVLPHLIRLGLPCSLAFMPDGLGTTGDDATWAELQEWSLNHGVELAHHARSHDDVPNALDDIPALEHQLLSSIEDANTNMPEVVADAFIMPGVSGTGYGGFNGGISDPSLLYTHPAGRMILSNFPVITWGMLGQAIPMTGEPVRFVDRIGIDTASFATLAQNKITSLQGTGMGISVFMHPAYLTVDGRITESRLVSFLEWLAAERNAGRVEVLTVSGFAYADTGSDRRLNLAPSEKWASNVFELEIDPLYNWAQGAQVVLETTAHTAGQFTLSATSDTGGLSASKKVDGVKAGDRLRLVFSIPKSAKKITLHAYGNGRSLKVV